MSIFKRAELRLEKIRFEPVNPTHLGRYNLPYEAYMEIDKVLISTCDAIYMLRNWEDSPGARREFEYAKELGLQIFYEQ